MNKLGDTVWRPYNDCSNLEDLILQVIKYTWSQSSYKAADHNDTSFKVQMWDQVRHPERKCFSKFWDTLRTYNIGTSIINLQAGMEAKRRSTWG